MELKDAVLSTLAELEDALDDDFASKEQREIIQEIRAIQEAKPQVFQRNIQREEESIQEIVMPQLKQEQYVSKLTDESMQKFLVSLRERILVLFEGLQTINTSGKNDILMLEKKVDLTINFFEFLLASIEEKLEVAPD